MMSEYLRLVDALRDAVTQAHSPVRVCIEDILYEIDYGGESDES